MNGQIINCYNKSNITGKQTIGGIVGQVANNSIIEKSYNLGSVNCIESNVGGITGALYNNSTIEKCYNEGEITGVEKIGGISGDVHIKSMLKKCYNIGTITGSNTVGGIVGVLYDNSLIQNIYNVSNVSGDDSTGGIVGRISFSLLQNGYNIGNLIGENKIGGIVGENADTSATITNTYVLENIGKDICGYNSTNEILEKNKIKKEEEIKSDSFVELLNNGENNWKEDTNNINYGYPILNWQ